VTTPPKITTALALQGGGALGAYQLGAYQALAQEGIEPDWFSGTSIGAIAAAILAGNPPTERAAKLQEFWHEISRPDSVGLFPGKPFQRLQTQVSYAEALAFGQPNFFTPRPVNPLLALPGPDATSFYDTGPLSATLERLISFTRLNDGSVRLMLGATDIATAVLTVFDNAKTRICADHVLASGALPPGFPPVEIGGAFYWDGGLLSNTPLDFIVEALPAGHNVVFVINLWQAAGPVPQTLDEVLWREKQIQFATRANMQVDAMANRLRVRHGQSAAATENGTAEPRQVDLVQIDLRSERDQFPFSDVDFSRGSIEERRAAGFRDMRTALTAQPWAAPPLPAHGGARVHRVADGRVATEPLAGEPAPGARFA
jgi:NTE family protein